MKKRRGTTSLWGKISLIIAMWQLMSSLYHVISDHFRRQKSK
jgi:hypothetical protein